MIVDLLKYIENNLPIRLRTLFNIEFIRMLLVQVVKVYNTFSLRVPDWLYRANTNASVIALQHHIKRSFDVDAVITELDGKPLDFLVSVNGFVDEIQLKSLIEQYKLAGKSFTFKVGSTVYTASFSDWICEDIRETWTVQFGDYVCEDNRKVKLTCDYRNLHVMIHAQRPVKSDMVVSVLTVWRDASGNETTYVHYIDLSANFFDAQESFQTGGMLHSISIISTTVNSDDYYDYIY